MMNADAREAFHLSIYAYIQWLATQQHHHSSKETATTNEKEAKDAANNTKITTNSPVRVLDDDEEERSAAAAAPAEEKAGDNDCDEKASSVAVSEALVALQGRGGSTDATVEEEKQEPLQNEQEAFAMVLTGLHALWGTKNKSFFLKDHEMLMRQHNGNTPLLELCHAGFGKQVSKIESLERELNKAKHTIQAMQHHARSSSMRASMYPGPPVGYGPPPGMIHGHPTGVHHSHHQYPPGQSPLVGPHPPSYQQQPIRPGQFPVQTGRSPPVRQRPDGGVVPAGPPHRPAGQQQQPGRSPAWKRPAVPVTPAAGPIQPPSNQHSPPLQEQRESTVTTSPLLQRAEQTSNNPDHPQESAARKQSSPPLPPSSAPDKPLESSTASPSPVVVVAAGSNQSPDPRLRSPGTSIVQPPQPHAVPGQQQASGKSTAQPPPPKLPVEQQQQAGQPVAQPPPPVGPRQPSYQPPAVPGQQAGKSIAQPPPVGPQQQPPPYQPPPGQRVPSAQPPGRQPYPVAPPYQPPPHGQPHYPGHPQRPAPHLPITHFSPYGGMHPAAYRPPGLHHPSSYPGVASSFYPGGGGPSPHHLYAPNRMKKRKRKPPPPLEISPPTPSSPPPPPPAPPSPKKKQKTPEEEDRQPPKEPTEPVVTISKAKMDKLTQELSTKRSDLRLFKRKVKGMKKSIVQHKLAKQKALWDLHYNQLVAFQSKYGHCRVPRSGGVIQGERQVDRAGLGRFVEMLRYQFRVLNKKEKDKNTNNNEQEGDDDKNKENENTNDAADSNDDDDNDDDEEQPEKPCNVGKKDGPPFKILAGNDLTPERIARLDAIGFEGELPKKIIIPWEQRYEHLKAFHKVQGHCRVPRNREEYKALGEWVHSQRCMRKNGIKFLDEEKIQLLDDLGFSWAPERHGTFPGLVEDSWKN